MKRGPASICQFILTQLDVSADPSPVLEIIVKATIVLGWHSTRDEAYDDAERWKDAVLQRLRDELDGLNRAGRFSVFTFNSALPDHVQGSAFIEPHDAEDVKDAKRRRGHFAAYGQFLQQISPREFEALCSGILKELGVLDPVLTQSSVDEGIDFYGKLPVGSKLLPNAVFPGIQSQMAIWMVGQAKHYVKGQVSTPDVRELVGSVVLARSRAFSVNRNKYADLLIRACDPVFVLFFSTGRISSQGWSLLEAAGVIGMDGPMVAAMLADFRVCTDGNNEFSEEMFSRWISGFLN